MSKVSKVSVSLADARWGDVLVTTYIEQLEWVIRQLPIVSIPEDGPLGAAVFRLSKSVTPYAYLSAKTWQNLTHAPTLPTFTWTRISEKCPTKFVISNLVPDGGIIFTPNKMPGAEGL